MMRKLRPILYEGHWIWLSESVSGCAVPCVDAYSPCRLPAELLVQIPISPDGGSREVRRNYKTEAEAVEALKQTLINALPTEYEGKRPVDYNNSWWWLCVKAAVDASKHGRLPATVFSKLSGKVDGVNDKSYSSELLALYDLWDVLRKEELKKAADSSRDALLAGREPLGSSSHYWWFRNEDIQGNPQRLKPEVFDKLSRGLYYRSEEMRSYSTKEEAMADLTNAASLLRCCKSELPIAEARPVGYSNNPDDYEPQYDPKYSPDSWFWCCGNEMPIEERKRWVLPPAVFNRLGQGVGNWSAYPSREEAIAALREAFGVPPSSPEPPAQEQPPQPTTQPLVQEPSPQARGGVSMFRAVLSLVSLTLWAVFALIGVAASGLVIGVATELVTTEQAMFCLSYATDSLTWAASALGGTSLLAAIKAARPHIAAAFRNYLVGLVRDQLSQE